MDFKQAIVDLLADKIKIDKDILEIPPDQTMGDYALPCFSFAKEMKKSPEAVAEELGRDIILKEPVHAILVKGSYLNFIINKAVLAKEVLNDVHDKQLDYGKATQATNIMVEYPSPNTNKPLHLGHVRNMLLGQSVANILEHLGNNITHANVNNDRGVHICKSMLAYNRWGKDRLPDIKTDHFVGRFYVLFAQNAKEKPELEDQAQEMLKQWEAGDEETVELWKLMNSWAYGGFEETYEKLGINFDKYYYESEYYKDGKDIIMTAYNKGIFVKDEENGAIIAPLEKFKLPDKVLVRGDGTSLYMTQDIYLAKSKFEEFKLDRSIYVVGSEQKNHFNQLFTILGLLDYPWADKCHHLSYGMVYLPEGKMKSREGTVVDADDIINEMETLAKCEILKRYHDISEEEVEKRSKIIGHGALRFFMLKMDPVKDMHYNPKESISFEGETGPYVQYAHARICSVLKKYGKPLNKQVNFELLKSDEEQALIKLLQNFPLVVEQAGTHLKPSLIARHLVDTAQSFTTFYHECQILTEKDDIMDARLYLIDAVKIMLAVGLDLLGMVAPAVM